MKLLFLGIDALDSDLLEKFSDQLPNFARLREKSASLKVISTFPPDSDTAWATISTGLNPAQHGIVKFVDPLEKSYRIMNKEDSNAIFQGNTFWDILAGSGLKTYSIFPHLCYPIWLTPAVMISRGKVSADVQSTVPGLLDSYPVPELLTGIRGLPDRNNAAMQEYYSRLNQLAEADADFALDLLKRNDWDVFFVYWSTLDAVGHLFWNTYDEADPFFKADNPFRDVIPSTYRLYDSIVGRFLDAVSDDTTVLLLSDHGQGVRPYIAINVNEMLRQAGYLQTVDTKFRPHVRFLENTKRAAIRFVSRFGLGKIAGRIMRHVPTVVQAFTRPALINWDKTVAFATDMSGIKAYTYGGIIINRDNLDGKDYEQVRTGIMDQIGRQSILPDGKSLLKFIARREDVYHGSHLSLYPDILLEFIYGYGVGWATNVPLITSADSYNLVPGSHRGETGTCMFRSPQVIARDEIDLLDIVPSLLDLFSIPAPRKYDGKSIFR
jgi:predicted AlkP superfamily phosphohydrolase/phosphomutase